MTHRFLPLALLFSVCSAHGAVLVSNLAEPDTGNPASVGAVGGGGIHQALAQSFTSNQPAILDSVTLNLINSGTTTDFTVSLFSDVGGSPAELLSTFTGDANPSSGVIVFSDPTSSLLATGTTYWVVAAAPTSTGMKLWTVTASDSENGEPAWLLGNVAKFQLGTGGWVASTLDSGAWQMAVSGTIVPEPSSAALLIFGLTALLSRRCRIPNKQIT